MNDLFAALTARAALAPELAAEPRRSIQTTFIPRDGRPATDFAARMRPETLARIGPVARYLLGVECEPG